MDSNSFSVVALAMMDVVVRVALELNVGHLVRELKVYSAVNHVPTSQIYEDWYGTEVAPEEVNSDGGMKRCRNGGVAELTRQGCWSRFPCGIPSMSTIIIVSSVSNTNQVHNLGRRETKQTKLV